MYFIPVKQLSVNGTYVPGQKKIHKRQIARQYMLLMCTLLPRDMKIYERMTLNVTFYFANSGSDIDNPLKIFIDALAKKYKFNDNRIYKLNVIKTVVGKKNTEVEGVSFSIENFDDIHHLNTGMREVQSMMSKIYLYCKNTDSLSDKKYELRDRLNIVTKAINYFNKGV